MKDVRTTGCFVGRALLAAYLLGALGCNEGGRFGVLTLEVAGPPGGTCIAGDRSSLGSTTPCVVLRVTRGGRPVELFRSEGDHGPTAVGAEELRFDSLQVSFDLRLPAGEPHDLEIWAYVGDTWTPAFGAQLEDIQVDQQEIRVRLYPLRAWACPGWRAQGEIATRALHRAVEIGNGDVLLLGGVTGENVDPAGAGRAGRVGALLQPVVEVYDQDEHRFHEVTVLEGRTFQRALFDTIYLGEEQPNMHRIRVVGGLTLPEGRTGTAVLGFDNRGTLEGNPTGLPFLPSSEAMPASTIDLLYDAEARTLQLDEEVDDNPTGTTQGAAITVSSPRDDQSRAILIGLTITGGGWSPAADYYATAPNGPHMLGARRIGATVDAIPLLDHFFIWGGNVSSIDVPGTAGELVSPDDPESRQLVPAVGLPPPVAFHTATPIGDRNRLVIAGGVLVEADGVLSFRYPAASDALQIFTFGPGLTASSQPVTIPGTMTYTPTILHTATNVPGFDVVLIGGARLVGEDRLNPVGTVARVRREGLVYALDDSVADLAQPRFGHTATLLRGKRLLVVGGFARDAGGLQVVGAPEVMFLGSEPYSSIRDGMCVDVADLPDDAGMDAGPPPIPDAGPMPEAGPMPDTGPPLPDAGM